MLEVVVFYEVFYEVFMIEFVGVLSGLSLFYGEIM